MSHSNTMVMYRLDVFRKSSYQVLDRCWSRLFWLDEYGDSSVSCIADQIFWHWSLWVMSHDRQITEICIYLVIISVKCSQYPKRSPELNQHWENAAFSVPFCEKIDRNKILIERSHGWGRERRRLAGSFDAFHWHTSFICIWFCWQTKF